MLVSDVTSKDREISLAFIGIAPWYGGFKNELTKNCYLTLLRILLGTIV
jgi:hypothetical protein